MSDVGFIREEDFVLIECNSVYVFLDRVNSSRKIKIHHSKFGANKIIGLRYGSLLEVVDSETHVITEQQFQNMHGMGDQEETAESNPCEIAGDNRNLIENPENQKLSEEEIRKLKKTGLKGTDVVSALVENSSTFQQKTAFSKEKYLKRKHKKHRIIIRLLRPSIPLLADWMTQRGRQRIGGLSSDTLSQLLSHINVSSGSRLICFDNCGGLVLLSLLHRMAGCGQVVDLHISSQTTQRVYRKIFDAVGVTESELAIVNDFPLQYTETLTQSELVDDNGTEAPETVATNNDEKADRRKARFEKLKSTWSMLKEAQFDGLIIATRNNPLPVLQAYFDSVKLSRPIVIFHQHRELLAPCFNWLVNSGRCVMSSMVSNLCREIQVLPGRTHPVIQMHGPSGYILFGTKAERHK